MNSRKKDVKNRVPIKAFKKKDSIIRWLDESIDYGKDLKRQIEHDNGRRLSDIKTLYENWNSNNSEYTQKMMPDPNLGLAKLFGLVHVITNVQHARALGYSEYQISRKLYEDEKRNLTSDVDRELRFLLSTRDTILEGNYCNEITWRISESIKKISKSSTDSVLGIIGIICTIICTIIGIIIAIIIA